MGTSIKAIRPQRTIKVVRTGRTVKLTRSQAILKAGRVGLPGRDGVGGGGGVTQVYSGAWDDPTGHVTLADPTKPAIYYKLQTSPVILWLWNTQSWFNALS